MSKPLRVLLIDDCEQDAELMVRELVRDGFEPESCRVETLPQIRAALEGQPWDIVLADYTLPDLEAPEALELLRKADPDMPVLLVSGTIGEEIAGRMMRAGVLDYIPKASLRRLAPAVRRELREAGNRRERRQSEQAAAQLAAIVQSSSDAIISETLDGIILSWNPAAERLFGWTAQEAVGRAISFIVPEDRVDELKLGLELVHQGKAIGQFDTVRQNRAGQSIDVAVTLSPVWDAAGRLTGVSRIIRDIRDRRRAEEALRQSEAHFRALIEKSFDAILLLDHDSTIQYASASATRLGGWSNEEYVGNRLWSWKHPEELTRQNAELQELLRYPGSSATNESRFRHKDGSWRWIESRLTNLLEEPHVRAIVLNFRDVTDRKRMEEARREAEARYRKLFEYAPDGILIADAESYYIDANASICRMLGYTRAELCGLHASDIVPRMELRHIEPAVEAIRSSSDYHREWQLRRKDGTLFAAEVLATMMPDGNMLGMIRDITERKKAEESLRLLERAIQAVTQGILITDPGQTDHPIVYASPGFERMTGYSLAEALGRDCRFLQGRDTAPEAIHQIRAALREARPCTVTMLNYNKDGGSFWNELSISPIRDEAGRLTHFVGVQTDVTQRRQLEEQYWQAQKMEAIGQLAGGTAHDFNNLLTVISGYCDLLMQGLAPDDPNRAAVEQIQLAGGRAASLTRQLLAFSRKQVVVPKELDLNAIVTSAEKMLRRVIGEDIRLETNLRLRRGRVRADAGQLDQVLLNLAVNARDAMPRGGRLTLETDAIDVDERHARSRPGLHAGPYARLRISDTGCGIPPEAMPRIFEPFFTTKESGKGTGLGLAVVHGIVRQAGGWIDVRSEAGQGATFEVYLPRLDAPAPPSQAAFEPMALPGGTETILLVEDESAVRTLASRLLSSRGYNVLEAADGNEALRVAERHPASIHLLLTDVVMPGLGGRQLAERLLEARPALKILFMSGYTDDAVVRHGILQEQVHFVQKPFQLSALTTKIRAMLDAR